MPRSYYADHLNEAGDFEFEVVAEKIQIDYGKYGTHVAFMKDILLKARLCSRHSNSIKYFIYLLVNKTMTGHSSCNCKVGQRIVGCCSHVATLICFLGRLSF